MRCANIASIDTLCVGLIGPRQRCRPVWRELHNGLPEEPISIKDSYPLSMLIGLGGGLPYTEVSVIGRSRAGAALALLLARVLGPQTVSRALLFRCHEPASVEAACSGLARPGLQLSLHWLGAAGAQPTVDFAQVSGRLLAGCHVHSEADPPEVVAGAINDEFTLFAERTGRFGHFAY